MEEEIKKEEKIKKEVKPEKAKGKKMKKGKKAALIVLCIFLALILVLVGTFFVLRYTGFKGFHKNDKNIKHDNIAIDDEDNITYKGAKYTLNKNIISILIIGIDRNNINENKGIGKNGQADCLFLAAIDTEKKTYTVIPISREAMVDVDVYTASGSYAGVTKEQICLAYAYGSSPEKCSENVLKSVRRMFYGLNINSYITIDLEGLSKLSEMVGGVEVTSPETILSSRGNIYEGQTTTVSGESALYFIRTRGNDIDANNRRMVRQKIFLSALVSKVGNTIMDDFTKLGEIYNSMQPYTSTNIGLSKITYFASSSLTRNIGSNIVYKGIEGTMTETKYSEFNINEEQLLDLIVETFYVKL